VVQVEQGVALGEPEQLRQVGHRRPEPPLVSRGVRRLGLALEVRPGRVPQLHVLIEPLEQ